MALHHATSGEVISLAPLGGGLASGQSHALVKTDRFEAIRLIVPAGRDIPEHHAPGYVTIHCLEGRVKVTSIDQDMKAGDWVFLERGAPHAVTGIEDSSLLLTIFFDPDPAERSG